MSGNIGEYQFSRTARQTRKDTLLIVEYVFERPQEPTLSFSSDTSYGPQNYWWLVNQYARLNKSLEKLQSLKERGVITDDVLRETIKQQVFLEDNRDKITEDRGYVVVCNEQFFYGKTLDEAVKKARETVGKKPYYSEPIDFIDYPSPFP